MEKVKVSFIVDKELFDKFIKQCENLKVDINTALCDLVDFQVFMIDLLSQPRTDA